MNEVENNDTRIYLFLSYTNYGGEASVNTEVCVGVTRNWQINNTIHWRHSEAVFDFYARKEEHGSVRRGKKIKRWLMKGVLRKCLEAKKSSWVENEGSEVGEIRRWDAKPWRSETEASKNPKILKRKKRNWWWSHNWWWKERKKLMKSACSACFHR